MGIIVFIICFAFILLYPFYEAKKDYKLILKDGSKDSLKEKFHTDNLLRRGTILAAVSFGANVFFDNSPLNYALLSFVFLLFAGCWFGFWFTSQLSFLRGLYPWYVSYDDRAAWTDQTIIKLAVRLNVTPEDLNKRIYTWSLIISFIIFVLTYFFIFKN